MTFVANKSVTTSGSGRFVGDLNGNADTVTNGVYTTDTNTVTGTMIASNTVTNTNLQNSNTTIGTTAIPLGGSQTTITGLASVTSTAFVGGLTGNVTGNVSGSAGTVGTISGHNIHDLANVSSSASPSTGQVLSWTGSAWSNTNPAATFTQADARNAISGGDGLAYNSSTGDMSAKTANGIEINSDNIELDYETVSSAPSGVGSTATGHLWFVI